MAQPTTNDEFGSSVAHVLATQQWQDDPYPIYRRLRQTAPLGKSEIDGVWYATGYDVCASLLRDFRCGHRREEPVQRYSMSRSQAGRLVARRGILWPSRTHPLTHVFGISWTMPSHR